MSEIICEFCDRTMPDAETALAHRWSEGWDGWICLSCDTGLDLCPCEKFTVLEGHICDIKYHQGEQK